MCFICGVLSTNGGYMKKSWLQLNFSIPLPRLRWKTSCHISHVCSHSYFRACFIGSKKHLIDVCTVLRQAEKCTLISGVSIINPDLIQCNTVISCCFHEKSHRFQRVLRHFRKDSFRGFRNSTSHPNAEVMCKRFYSLALNLMEQSWIFSKELWLS